MVRSWLTAPALVLALVTSGCAHTPLCTDEGRYRLEGKCALGRQGLLDSLKVSSSLVERVVIYRVSGEGGDEAPVSLDGWRLGELNSNDFGVVEVPPGPHQLIVGTRDAPWKTWVAVGGRTLFLRIATFIPPGKGELPVGASFFLGWGLAYAIERKLKDEARQTHLWEVERPIALREIVDEEMQRHFRYAYARRPDFPPPAVAEPDDSRARPTEEMPPPATVTAPPAPPVAPVDGGVAEPRRHPLVHRAEAPKPETTPEPTPWDSPSPSP